MQKEERNENLLKSLANKAILDSYLCTSTINHATKSKH